MVNPDMLSLEISDDGRGIAEGDLDKDGSFGLRGLSERVRQVRGWIDIPTGVPRGMVMLTIPLSEQAAARLESGDDS